MKKHYDSSKAPNGWYWLLGAVHTIGYWNGQEFQGLGFRLIKDEMREPIVGPLELPEEFK